MLDINSKQVETKIGKHVDAPVRDFLAFYIERFALHVRNFISSFSVISPNHSRAFSTMELDEYKNGIRFITRRRYGNKAFNIAPDIFMKAEDLQRELDILKEKRAKNES